MSFIQPFACMPHSPTPNTLVKKGTNIFMPDILREVMTNLHPNSLLSLMCTNKGIYENIKSNKQYFEEYAVYVLFRERLYPFFHHPYWGTDGPVDYKRSIKSFVVKTVDHIQTKYNVTVDSSAQIVRLFHGCHRRMGQTIKDYVESTLTISIIKENVRCFFNSNLYTENLQRLFRLVVYLRESSGLRVNQIYELRTSLAYCLKDYDRDPPDVFQRGWFQKHGLTPLGNIPGKVYTFEQGFKQWLYYMKHYFQLNRSKLEVWKKIVLRVKKMAYQMRHENDEIQKKIHSIINRFFDRHSVYTLWK